MRTQSLGNVEPSKKNVDSHSLQEKSNDNCQSNTLGRKVREKEWRETALDSECYERRSHTPPLHPRANKMTESPVPQRPVSMRSTVHTPPPPLPPPHCPIPPSPPPVASKSPIKSPVLVDTVPFESPKNHTVVEVGKWQPYREVTKPFEMSDFYKYSTKFRKINEQSSKKGSSETQHTTQNCNVTNARNSETMQENLPAYEGRSNDDINKNNVNEVPYYDPAFLNNITHRRYHRPLTVVNDSNDNNILGKQWCNET
mgnify:CR=1 FL=1